MANDYGVVTLDGADYTTLQALEISTEDLTYPGVIHLRNESRHVTIDSCYVHAPKSSNIQQKVTLLNMYAKSKANANNDHLTLQRSLLEGGYMGVRLGGTGTVALPKEVGGCILNNVFRNQESKAIYVAREADAHIEGNIVENETSTHNVFNAVDIDATGDVRLARNRINLSTKGYCTAVYVRNMSGLPTAQAQIVNNVVMVGHGTTPPSRNVSKALTLKGDLANLLVAHNSLCVEGNEKDIAVGILGKMADNVRLVNNLFANTGKGVVYQCTRKENLASLRLDHNNLYTNGPSLADVGAPIATLSAWMALSGERYAYNNKVEFASDVLLQPLSEPELRHATPLAVVPTDILGQQRNTLTPLIGAYERAWQGPSTAIVAPSASANGIQLSVYKGVLSLSSLPANAVVEVFSTSGMLLSRHALPANANSLQVTGLPQGVLVVRVMWNNGKWSKAIRL